MPFVLLVAPCRRVDYPRHACGDMRSNDSGEKDKPLLLRWSSGSRFNVARIFPVFVGERATKSSMLGKNKPDLSDEVSISRLLWRRRSGPDLIRHPFELLVGFTNRKPCKQRGALELPT